jgi:hypothetical protein
VFYLYQSRMISSKDSGGDTTKGRIRRGSRRFERRFVFVVVDRRRDFRQFKVVPRTTQSFYLGAIRVFSTIRATPRNKAKKLFC